MKRCQINFLDLVWNRMEHNRYVKTLLLTGKQTWGFRFWTGFRPGSTWTIYNPLYVRLRASSHLILTVGFYWNSGGWGVFTRLVRITKIRRLLIVLWHFIHVPCSVSSCLHTYINALVTTASHLYLRRIIRLKLGKIIHPSNDILLYWHTVLHSLSWER